MKCRIPFCRLLLCLLLLPIFFGYKPPVTKEQASITGAWKLDDGSNDHVLIFADGYMTHAAFNSKNKLFMNSRGGSYRLQNGTIQIKWEYDTEDKEKAGQFEEFSFTVGDNGLVIVFQGRDITLARIDDGTGPLAGNWRISGRMSDGKINPVNTGDRKTLKLLSGTRFQWVAINPGTKEFFGTGGGTYTFTEGKYTENLQFFSRDSSRVNTSLSFDDKIENGDWHHTGQGTTGQKLYEIWSRVVNPEEKK